MRILERHIQTLEPGGWETYQSKEKQWLAIEARLGGFSQKHYYVPMSNWSGTTVIWEREWESMAAMESAYESMMDDDEVDEMAGVPSAIVEDRVELHRAVTRMME